MSVKNRARWVELFSNNVEKTTFIKGIKIGTEYKSTDNVPLFDIDGKELKKTKPPMTKIIVPWEEIPKERPANWGKRWLKLVKIDNLVCRVDINNIARPFAELKDFSFLRPNVAISLIYSHKTVMPAEVQFENNPVGPCKSFNSAQEIANAILVTTKNATQEKPEIFELYKNIVSATMTGTHFDPIMFRESLNNIGPYLGELLIGIYLFRKRPKLGNFSGYTVKKFYFPLKTNLPLFDSFAVISVGGVDHTIAFSSKFNKGAASSFNSNILPRLSKIETKDKELNDIISKFDSCSSHQLRLMEVVFHYIFNKYKVSKKGVTARSIVEYEKSEKRFMNDKKYDNVRTVVDNFRKAVSAKDGRSAMRKDDEAILKFCMRKVCDILNDNTHQISIINALKISGVYQVNLVDFDKGYIKFNIREFMNVKRIVFSYEGKYILYRLEFR